MADSGKRKDAARSCDLSRRALLTGFGAGGAALLAGSRPAEAAAEAQEPERGPAYRETEHIRRFYALSRF